MFLLVPQANFNMQIMKSIWIRAFLKDLTVNAQDKDGNSPLHLVQMKHSQLQKRVIFIVKFYS